MYATGRKPFGSRPGEGEVITVIKLKARKRKGGRMLGPGQIARELNTEALKTQMGHRWTAQGVKNILARSQQPQKANKNKYSKKTQLESGDYLTAQQVRYCLQTLMEVGKSDDRMIFRVLVGTGLRASELCDLQVRDLGLEAGKSQVDVRRGKGCKQRSVFIDPGLAGRLRAYLQARHRNSGRKAWVFTNTRGDKLTYDSLYYRIRKIGDKVGIAGFRPHALRHTFATLLYDYKKDLFFVQEQLGHASSDTTKIYAKTLNTAKKEQLLGFAESIEKDGMPAILPENTSKLEKPVQIPQATTVMAGTNF